MVQLVLPAFRRTPADSTLAVREWKLNTLQLETVLPLLSFGDAVPVEQMPLTGVLAPSRMSHWSIVLLSLPSAPVVVLNKTVPLLALVFTPASVRCRIVLLLASLMKQSATPAFAVFAMVSCFAVPVPPGRPSRITFCAPFKYTVAAVVFALVMASELAPMAGRMVRLFAALEPVSTGMVSGNVSTLLT